MLRLEFWLPLPLIGLAFWFISGLITDHGLKHSQQSLEPYEIMADTAQPKNQILYIKVMVDRQDNTSEVKVKQATQVYQKQEFNLATAEFEQIEAQISQKLDLSTEQVTQLLRYQIKQSN